MKKVIALQEKLHQYIWNFFQSNDYFEVVPRHEVNKTNESQAPTTQEGEPSTLQEALNNPDASLWKEAMQEEIEALYKNKTWELVPLPEGRKPIRNKWVYRIKRNGDDQVERYRERLVVKGYAQKEGIDFNEIFFLVVRMITIRVVMAMCATYDLHLEQLDVKTAFLQGNIEEEIFMLQPKGFEQKGKENLAPNKDRNNKLKAQLAREFKIKDLGPANKILEMQIHRDRLSSKMSSSSEKERMEMSQVPYASAVGSLMFAMICTRPDIAHAVGVVSRYMAEPGREHWEAVKRILRYIKGTSKVALCYGESNLTIIGYVDFDYACDLDRSKSTTEYVFTLSGGIISWVSKQQSFVAMSTMEAEYVAVAQARRSNMVKDVVGRAQAQTRENYSIL
nr:integrase, catalytic core [Tanacetum cinerariifolium]